LRTQLKYKSSINPCIVNLCYKGTLRDAHASALDCIDSSHTNASSTIAVFPDRIQQVGCGNTSAGSLLGKGPAAVVSDGGQAPACAEPFKDTSSIHPCIVSIVSYESNLCHRVAMMLLVFGLAAVKAVQW
jgi:hypothetical protein